MDKFLCVMAGFDIDTDKKLEQLQKELLEKGFIGNQTKGIPNHVTLGFFDCDKEEEACELLKETAKRLNKFEVEFHHIGIFGGGEVLFAAPDINRNLLEIKEVFGDSKGWTPHATLLIDKPETIVDAAGTVLRNFVQFKGEITTLYLYEFFPSRYIKSVELI